MHNGDDDYILPDYNDDDEGTKSASQRDSEKPKETGQVSLEDDKTAVPGADSSSKDYYSDFDGSSTTDDENYQGVERDTFGYELAEAMKANGYHPVMLFGMTNSGKTAVLLSLFALLFNHSHRLQAGIKLGAPLLGATGLGADLHKYATDLFEIGTESYTEGEKIRSTKSTLPFFLPIEFEPKEEGKPPIKFAFLESQGEWYSSFAKRGGKIADLDQLYRDLPPQIQQVLERYPDGMSFLHIAPYTQEMDVYGEEDPFNDNPKIKAASLALAGALKGYNSVRLNSGRSADRHLMLVTKWDRRLAEKKDQIFNRAEVLREDKEELGTLFIEKYSRAHSAFTSLRVDEHQKALNAYCSGMMDENGLKSVNREEEQEVIDDYPTRLWRYLYRNALVADGQAPIDPFPAAKQDFFLLRMLKKILKMVSGG